MNNFTFQYRFQYEHGFKIDFDFGRFGGGLYQNDIHLHFKMKLKSLNLNIVNVLRENNWDIEWIRWKTQNEVKLQNEIDSL